MCVLSNEKQIKIDNMLKFLLNKKFVNIIIVPNQQDDRLRVRFCETVANATAKKLPSMAMRIT